jgi:N-acetylglucosamine-6-sulfatase
LLTDDLDRAEMAYMPIVRRLLTNQGVSFTNYFISDSLCCPSRTSILRGQYAHDTGVESNGDLNGGFETAYRLGIEKSTVGTWMHDAGYRTAYIGKYLNQYPDSASRTYEPPGWDEFDSAVAGNPYSEYDYVLNENKHLRHFGHKRADYGTTVYINKARQFIETSKAKPFFLYLNVYAPHQPATPAGRDRKRFENARAPRTPAFDALPPGKPGWLRQLHHLGPRGIASLDALFRARIRSLQAVDRGVGELIGTLQATHRLDSTYFVFSSDNGFHLGQFQMPAGKETPYDTDIRVPLIVRGPGVPAGKTSHFMVGNIDLAPTFAKLGGAAIPAFVDGRSFASLLHDPAADPRPRHAYLLEHWRASRSASYGSGSGPSEPADLDSGAEAHAKPLPGKTVPFIGPGYIPRYFGLRTQHYMYVEYRKRSEMYAISRDPYELHNIVYDPADIHLVARFHNLLVRLKRCAAETCRSLEDAPIPVGGSGPTR